MNIKPKSSTSTNNLLPLFDSKIQAGFPSPADDHLDLKLDLNKYLITHPAATFLTRVIGDSMINAGIFENDILVVDRSIQAVDGKIVIAVSNGELTVKRLKYNNGKSYLAAENDAYKPIEINIEKDTDSTTIWGVVTSVIRKL